MRPLEIGQVKDAPRRFAQIFIFGVFGEADDFDGNIFVWPFAKAKALPNRILFAEEITGHRLVNHGHWRGVRLRLAWQPNEWLQFLWAEVASLQERNTH